MPNELVNFGGSYEAEMARILRQQRMAEALRQQSEQDIPINYGGGAPAPISWGSVLAKGLQSYSANKKERDIDDSILKAQEDDKRRREELVKYLAPEQFSDIGGGAQTSNQLSGGGTLTTEIPNIQDTNADRRKAMAMLLENGIGGEVLAGEALKKAGFGPAAQPIKLGKDDRLLDPSNYSEIVGAIQPKVEPKAPTTREINIGDEVVTQEWDGSKWVEVGRGGRYRPPSTTVNVNADRSFGSALGGGAADILDASSAAARGAVQTIGTVNQIRGALETGKVTAGPGTTALQFFGQLTGGDPQRLQATRTTMQNLAKLTLDARGALKGQGTITDREQQLLERAVSGDIDNLSIPEIITITDAAERLARASIKSNAAAVERARRVPSAGNMPDFFAVEEPPPYQPPVPQQPAQGRGGRSGRFVIESVR